MSTSNVSVGGRRTFDLTTDREHESNYELVQIPAVSTINVESSDSEAFLHFGTPTSDGFSTFEYSKFTFKRRSPDALYLENSAGATGSLTLTFGVDMDPETDLTIDSVESIDSTVTTDVTDDSTRQIGKARVMDSGGVLVDPASDQSVNAEQTRASATLASVATGQQAVGTAGTAEALNGGNALAVPDGATLVIRADTGLTGTYVYVGDSTVSASSGYKITGGDVVELAVDDVSTVYIDADSGGDGVSWVVEQ